MSLDVHSVELNRSHSTATVVITRNAVPWKVFRLLISGGNLIKDISLQRKFLTCFLEQDVFEEGCYVFKGMCLLEMRFLNRDAF